MIQEVPYGQKTQIASLVPEIDILWITAGLGCDGDTISMTAATQPSLKDIILGAIAGLPIVRLHNSVLAYQNGSEFLEPFRQAAAGKLAPFILVVEGSIPNERNKPEGCWAGLGPTPPPASRFRHATGSIDSHQSLGRRRDWNVRRLRRNPRHRGQPHRLHGPVRLPRLGLDLDRGIADREHTRLSGPSGQLHGDAALSPHTGGRTRR